MAKQLRSHGFPTLEIDDQRDHIIGPRNAPVTLLEYGDFECPYCGRAHYELQDILEQFGDEVRFAFRHFPLSQLHPHAAQAAEASEAAASQNQFWPMHDMLFENQAALAFEDIMDDAQELGLDLGRFENELLQSMHRARVREDFYSGVRNGVNGTPTFFINGHRHDQGWEFDSLASAIETEWESQPQHGGSQHQRRSLRKRR